MKSGTLLLILIFLIASCYVTPLCASAEPETIVVPDDYGTIQEAVNRASQAILYW